MRQSARNALLATVLAALCCAASPAAAGATITLPSGFQQRTVLSDLSQPTAVRFAPNGSPLVFVAEKRGTIQVFDGLTDTTPAQVINLRREVFNNGDRGLLGLAVDPGFPDRPYIYALYARDATFAASTGAAPDDVASRYQGVLPPVDPDTQDDDNDCDPYGPVGCEVSGRLVRIEVNPVTGVMVPGTPPNPKPLLSGWCQQFSSHSLGDLRFGADGQLYVSGGEGANYDNPDLGQFSDPCPHAAGEGGALRAQDASTPGDAAGTSDPTNLNGAVLRIDPDTGAASVGNPATSGDANQHRIIGYGLRNPYRLTFRPGTNDLWFGDVGWGRWEEINRIPDATQPAKNFGWPCFEGDWQDNNPQAEYKNASPALCNAFYAVDGAGITPPFFSYYHTTYEEDPSYSGPCYPTQLLSNYNLAALTGSAITGLSFYDGGDYPASYGGGLFFGDYGRGCLWFMGATGGIPDPAKVQPFGSWNSDTDIGLVSLERGPGGDIFIVDIISGSVRRLRYGAVDARAAALDPTSGPNPLTVHLTAAGSTTVGATITKYQWDLNGDGTFETDTGTSPLATATFPDAGVTNVKVRVTDSLARTGESDPLKIEAGKKPTVVIDSPSAGAAPWKVGDQLAFHGSAYDGAGQPLGAASLTWDLVLRHCPGGPDCHSHFIAGNLSGLDGARHGAGGTFITPDHSYPSHLELQLTAKDADGLSTTVTRRLDPATVDIALASDPAGRTLTADDKTAAAPFICTVIKGSQTTVSANLSETAADRLFSFASWSDGGAASHTFTATADTSLTATYTSASAPGALPVAPAKPAAAPPVAKPVIRLGGTLRVSRKGVVGLRVRCPGPGSCRASLRLDTVAAKSTAARRLATALVKRIGAGRSTTVHVTLGPSTRRLLATRRSLKAIATVTVTPSGRTPATTRTSYTLRAPAR